MRCWIAVFVLGGFLAGAAIAQDVILRSLLNGDDASPWQAVGRLDFGGNSFCTGALIEPNLVLTAAHCLFDSTSGDRINHDSVQFLAGWRNGRASAYRGVRRAVVHPEYVYDGRVSSERVRNDVALLELVRPIRNTTVKPFGTSGLPREGDRVGVVSYAHDRSNTPSLQEVCEVIARRNGMLITSCSVDFGSSGAPIFSFENGTAEIVSVVSAKAEIDGQKVSLGTTLSGPLKHLRAELDRSEGAYRNAVPTVSNVAVGEKPKANGAKFVKPEN